MTKINDIKNIILASGSPRRKELMSSKGLTFTVIKSDVEEIITKTVPKDIVGELSFQKAQNVFNKISGDYDEVLVIGADTIVALENQILCKPKDKQDARQMISSISGGSHSVFTGVTLYYKKGDFESFKTFVEETRVHVKSLSASEIEEYISTDEPYDKAGGYAIQGIFGKYIEGYEGDYNNVVGFPIDRVIMECEF